MIKIYYYGKCIDCKKFLTNPRAKRCKPCDNFSRIGQKNNAWKGGTPICKNCDKHTAAYHLKTGMCRKCRIKSYQLDETKHPRWSGNNPTYRALHKWLYKHLGQPDTCEHCKTSGLTRHKIHWASKSKKYKRDISDWIRLCVSCHKKFDSHNIM